MDKVNDKYVQLGGANGFLGKPASEETACPDGVGRYRHYERGSIYWHPLTGAYEVHGLIRAKWAKLGWERSFLGYPKTDESDSGGSAKGRFNLFQGGAITWKRGAKEAFETHGAIRSKFGQMGWESGFLGFPLIDETSTPDGVGRCNHFDGGSIYWKPSISAHEVHGLIGKLWADRGRERSAELGYPVSDEVPTYERSKDRFSDFENGVVHWQYGAREARILKAFPIGGQTVAEVTKEINKLIADTLKSDSQVYIKSGPALSEVTDYRWDGVRVHNRIYGFHVTLGVDIPTALAPDATSDLDFWIEIDFDRAKGTIWASLYGWKVHTHVPFPSSTIVSAGTINQKFKAILDPMVGVPQSTHDVSYLHLLSAKVMANGDLNIYALAPQAR